MDNASPTPSTSAEIQNQEQNNLLLVRNTSMSDNDEIEREKLLICKTDEYLKKSDLLHYEQQMFLDIIYNDGFVVCAKGISFYNVLINFLKVYDDPANLVLVVNSNDREEKYCKSHLDNRNIHNSHTNSNERERIYLEGGIHFISTRILVVDLLKKRIPIELITGVIVLGAHKIIESCQEAFALRLYRQSNKSGFIKAFTNSVESFTYGYGHVEKVIRNLFLKELYIWPRIHALIQTTLKQCELKPIELHVPMTAKMMLIQTYILDIMNYLVKELKRLNRYIDLQEVTLENCATKKFHKILQAQLDCVWYQLSSQTKLILTDLKVLRILLSSLIHSDAVSMYVLTKKYRSQPYALNNSGWVLLKSAEKLFSVCKERIYTPEEVFQPEHCPKWKILSRILCEEIPEDIKRSNQCLNDPVKVLILCQDAHSAHQLYQYLTVGGQKYLLYTALQNDLAAQVENYECGRENNGSIHVHSIEGALQSKFKKPDVSLSDDVSVSRDIDSKNVESAKISLKRKKKLEDNNETKLQDSKDLIESDLTYSDTYRESYILTLSKSKSPNEDFELSDLESGNFETFVEMENLEVTQLVNFITKPIVCIQTFKSYEDGVFALEKVLNVLKPKYVIMYHYNITAIRQLEVFSARQLEKQTLKVFFMAYTKTVEEQSYLTSLRREKQAFDHIIEAKSTMVISQEQDGKQLEMPFELNQNNLEDDVAVNNRHGGNPVLSPIIPRIIVDMREFRSDLPCLIHKRGIEVVPLTISIGDYVLTPDVCVERKSISDLIGSLNSGRLYNQCIQMVRNYSRPILLIEFEQTKPFHLNGSYMISVDSFTSNTDITDKLVLLTMNFVKLRLVWSPNPYSTVKLFEEIKHGKPEPNSSTAASLGSDQFGSDLDTITDSINLVIYDILLKFPGINTKNIYRVMKSVHNMIELFEMDKSQLTRIMDNEKNATLLYNFLNFNSSATANQQTNAKPKYKFKARRGGGRF